MEGLEHAEPSDMGDFGGVTVQKSWNGARVQRVSEPDRCRTKLPGEAAWPGRTRGEVTCSVLFQQLLNAGAHWGSLRAEAQQPICVEVLADRRADSTPSPAAQTHYLQRTFQ